MQEVNDYITIAPIIQDRMLTGKFNHSVREQFLSMLEYFGQSPIIVRSSSLLEDGFGNAFAGKYESVFCANQGTLGVRQHHEPGRDPLPRAAKPARAR